MIRDLKPYPGYKDSGVPWLGRVPDRWEIMPALAAYKPRLVKNTGMAEKTVLSLSYGQIIVKPTEKLHGLVPQSFETYQIVDPSDIIVRTTDLQNDHTSLRVGIARHRGIITSAYLCLRASGGLSPDYGYLLLNAYDLSKVLYGYGSGLRQNLDFADIKRMPVLVPPAPEQFAIIRVLDHFDRRIQRYIHAKQKLIALLNEQKQAIIHRAVTRGLDPNVRLKPSGVEWLGDVPGHWEIKRLKWATRLQRGYDLPADRRIAGPFPVVSSGGIIGTHSKARSTSPGVVMGRYGSTDAVFYIETDFWPHNTSLFVTDFQGNRPRWCYFMLKTISKEDYSGKSAVPGVDRKDLFDIKVAVPPVAEQDVLIARVDIESVGLDRAIAAVQREVDFVRDYRTRLIADVVTGKLDVREAAAGLPKGTAAAEPLEDIEPLGEPENSDLEVAAEEVDA